MRRILLAASLTILACASAFGQAGIFPQNSFYAGPSTGGAGFASPRAIVGADLPNPAASTLGGVKSLTCSASQWLNTISIAGLPVCAQPAFSDISGRFALSQAPQGVANSIWINPTGSTANMQNIAVPACANDGGHGLVYVNGSGLACATLTTGGTVTNVATAGLATGGPITTTGTVTVTAAIKSDQQTGTSTTTAVTPAQQQSHDSAAKAWVSFTGSTGAIQASYNVSSVTRSAAGAYTVNFTTAFANALYVCNITAEGSGGAGVFGIVSNTTRATGSVGVITLSTAFSGADPTTGYVVCFGRQ